MKRELEVVPNGVVDREGRPRFGTYQGELPGVGLENLRGEYAPAPWQWLVRRKRWNYAVLVTEEVILCQAVVDGRYFGNGFVYAVDLYEEKAVLVGSTVALPDLQVKVNDRAGRGHRAQVQAPGLFFSTKREECGHQYRWESRLHPLLSLMPGGVSVEAEMETRGGAPALTVISPVEGGIVNVTQKWAGLATKGRARIGTRSYDLEGGVAGLDYTQGILGRQTRWRWAMALGRLVDGRRVGINLVAGFNDDHPDANENALWIGDRLISLDRAEFVFDRKAPEKAWEVRTGDGSVDLSFTPYYIHREMRNLGVIKSFFLQPAGRFEGVIRLDGQTHPVVLHGVMEDQDVRW